MEPMHDSETLNTVGGVHGTAVQVAPPESEHNSTLMGLLAYIGILVLIPLLLVKNDPFVQFHVKQGLVLLVMEAIVWIAGKMIFLSVFWPIIIALHLLLVILSIIGIVNVLQKKEKELPLVGSYAKNFTI